MVRISVPEEAIGLLLLQRTGYRSPVLRYLYAPRTIGQENGRRRYQRFGSALKKWFMHTVDKKFSQDMTEIFETFRQYVPKSTTHVLDIGSGMGGINVLTHRALDSRPEIWLLDKSGVSAHQNSGYHSDASEFSYYNSFEYAVSLLTQNGVNESKIVCCNVDTAGFPVNQRFDVIYSFLSWGFHYPIAVYLEDAFRSLSKGGVLIADLRKRTDGKDVMARRFGKPAKIIYESHKFERVLFVK